MSFLLPKKKKSFNRHKVFVGLASLTIILLTLPIFFNIKISAEPTYQNWVQTTWVGGAHKDPTTVYEPIDITNINQYSEADNLDSATIGEINFGGAPTANETGWLISSVFDMGDKSFFGDVSFTPVGNGTATIQIRSDSYDDMSTALDWSECNSINTNTDIYSSSCINRGERYFQYKITLTNDSETDELSVTDVTFQYNNDNTGPTMLVPTLAQLSSKIRDTPADTYTWGQAPLGDIGWQDDESGVAGMKYCLADALNNDGNPWDDCDPSLHPESFVGPAGNTNVGTSEYINDIYPINNNRLTTNPLDPRYAPYTGDLSWGMFIVTIKALDNVGNFETSNIGLAGSSSFFISKFSSVPSAPPQSVISTNTVPGTNMFSFSWTAPTVAQNPMMIAIGGVTPESPDYQNTLDMVTFLVEGSSDEMSYCYAINKSPNPNDDNYDPNWVDNCTKTAKVATTLPADNYGLHQGINTLYMASINEAGNLIPYIDVTMPRTDDNGEPVLDDEGQPIYDSLSGGNYSQTEFNVETFAPDVPRNVEVVDISNRTTETWRVVLSWIAPLETVPAVERYQIFRSVDGTTWASVGYTDSLSYVDTDPGLNSTTTYYYQIKACDNADSCSTAANAINIADPDRGTGIKPDGHYTAPADLTSGPTANSISTRKATIEWQTNRESDSKIFMSTSPNVSTVGVYSAGDASQSFSHSIKLSNLQPNTKYYYKTTWTDIDNNTGRSAELSFTTLPAPLFSEVGFSSISIGGASVDFTVENANNVNIYFGKTESFGGVQTVNTSTAKSTYSIKLSDLDDGKKYYVKINGFDTEGNEYPGSIYSFSTLSRPRISNLRFQPVADASSNTTKVTWTTNVPTNSMLRYGPVGGQQLETIDSKLVIDHEVTITGLEDDKDYTLVARSTDASGNVAVSDTQTFRTALDTRPPKISNINIDTSIKGSGAEARGQVIVSWTTDELSTSQVAYGQGDPGSYSNKTSEDSQLTMDHTVIISDLSTSSIYQVQPLSKDKAANESKGTNQSAIIGRGTEDVFTIIFNSLRNIFGIRG